jgi:hypothetical protein
VDPQGLFALGESAFPPGALLRVEAPRHAAFEERLPAAGEMAIALVSRRRRLLDRMVAFAQREWGPSDQVREPTPDQVAKRARRAVDPTGSARGKQIEAYARATERMAYGPTDVDKAAEDAVLSLEPR